MGTNPVNVGEFFFTLAIGIRGFRIARINIKSYSYLAAVVSYQSVISVKPNHKNQEVAEASPFYSFAPISKGGSLAL